jgi:electron transport complex protein RnfA
MKEMFALILAGVLASNFALTRFLGVETVLGQCRSTVRPLFLGLAVLATTVISSILSWVVTEFALCPCSVLVLPIDVIFVLGVTALVELFCRKVVKKSLGSGFALIALNSAVLGVSLLNTGSSAKNYVHESFLTTLVAALAAGIGYLVVLCVYTAIRNRIDDCSAPKAMRGLPLSLLTAGFICLALGCLSF